MLSRAESSPTSTLTAPRKVGALGAPACWPRRSRWRPHRRRGSTAVPSARAAQPPRRAHSVVGRGEWAASVACAPQREIGPTLPAGQPRDGGVWRVRSGGWARALRRWRCLPGSLGSASQQRRSAAFSSSGWRRARAACAKLPRPCVRSPRATAIAPLLRIALAKVPAGRGATPLVSPAWCSEGTTAASRTLRRTRPQCTWGCPVGLRPVGAIVRARAARGWRASPVVLHAVSPQRREYKNQNGGHPSGVGTAVDGEIRDDVADGWLAQARLASKRGGQCASVQPELKP